MLFGKSAGSSCGGETPRITYLFLNKYYSRTNDLGGSARILACPSREPLLCFLSVGLARKAHEPKKVLQGWSEVKKVEIF